MFFNEKDGGGLLHKGKLYDTFYERVKKCDPIPKRCTNVCSLDSPLVVHDAKEFLGWWYVERVV